MINNRWEEWFRLNQILLRYDQEKWYLVDITQQRQKSIMAKFEGSLSIPDERWQSITLYPPFLMLLHFFWDLRVLVDPAQWSETGSDFSQLDALAYPLSAI